MVTDRKNIQGYFDTAEEVAITKFAETNGITKSKALEALVKIATQKDSEVPTKQDLERLYAGRIERVEKGVCALIDANYRRTEKAEKLEEQIADLHCEMDRLLKTVKDESTRYLSDEQIAAITGQSEWKVKLWRHGIQKPRGKRIKQKLESYVVVDGKWRHR